MDPFHQIAITGITTPEEASTGVSGFRLLRVTGIRSGICSGVKRIRMEDHISSYFMTMMQCNR